MALPIPAAPVPDWGLLRRRYVALTGSLAAWREARHDAAQERRMRPPPLRGTYLEHSAMAREMDRL